MSTALTALRQRLLRELDLGWIITNADLGALAATSITSTNMLRNSLWGPTYFSDQNCVIFRPGAASSADYIRYAGDLANTTGVLSHTGANYADTTVGSEVVEIWKYGIRPTREIVESLNRCLEFEFVTSLHALSHGSTVDYGMELSTDTNWTDIGVPSVSAKSTDASTTYGPRAYQLNNANINEGTRSSLLDIRAGATFNAFAIGLCTAGTLSLQPYDGTNTAAFGTAVTHSERAPQLMVFQSQTMPATGKRLGLNLINTSATGVSLWNAAWVYRLEDTVITLPTFITEAFMAPRVLQARPRTSTDTGTYSARDLDWQPLTEGVDYWLVISHADAAAYKIRFRDNSYFNWPLFVEYRRPQSDFVTMAEDETAVVNVPVHNLLPRWKIDVLDTILLGKIPRDKYELYHEKAEKELIISLSSRPTKSIAPARPFYRGVTRL